MVQSESVSLPTLGDYNGIRVVRWQGIGQNESSEPVELVNFADRTVQVSGVFGGATAHIEGSIDGETYSPLTDPQGNALTFSSNRLETISEVVRFIRPRVSGGSAETAVSVHIIFRKG